MVVVDTVSSLLGFPRREGKGLASGLQFEQDCLPEGCAEEDTPFCLALTAGISLLGMITGNEAAAQPCAREMM